jgi:hypothetical protein
MTMFEASRPVWAKDRADELNLHLEFRIDLPDGSETVRMTASTAYQLFLDDECAAYGPARAGDGHFRVDEWNVRGKSRLRVLVAGYAACSFQYTFHPSFLNLEILDRDGNVLVATGRDEILCREYTPKLRFTDKYSRQRLFTEVYDFTRAEGDILPLEIQPDPIYLPRGVKPFSNRILDYTEALADFNVCAKEFDESLLHDGLSPMHRVDYFRPGHPNRFEHFECFLYREINSIACSDPRPAAEGPLSAGTARIFAFDADRAGQIGLNADAEGETEVYIAFDEMLTDGDVDPLRLDSMNAVKFTLPAGSHRLLTFEPYTFKYLKVIVTKGCLRIDRELIDVYRMSGGFSLTVLWRVYLPLMAGYLRQAYVNAVGMGVKLAVSTEYLVQTKNSLGRAVTDSTYFLEYQDVYAYALIMILLVLLLSELPLAILRRLQK